MKKQSEAMIPTPNGDFRMIAYADDTENQMPHVVLMHTELADDEDVVIRIHSECLTGDLFGSKRCDCGEQLERSLEIIGREKGILIYLRQEGRGIGLINKLKAYELQDKGMNTIDANLHLGFEPDERDYEVASEILKDLEIKSVRILTNNPEKVVGINNYGIKVSERLPIVIEPSQENKDYLQVKNDLMGHILE
jgi:3,4-dihydroxy 2-butanone 4-phosphate synthase/GTP cyclohydrolase II